MQKKLILLSILVMLILVQTLSSQNLINDPDCATYDVANDRYFISNYYEGSIVAIDNEGTHSYFAQGLGITNASHIVGNTIYATGSYTYLYAWDLTSGDLLWVRNILGSNQLDGIMADNSGYLYLTDYNFAGLNKIFKVNISDQTSELYISSGLDGQPQDLHFDEDNNRMLLTYYDSPGRIMAIDLTDASLSTIVTAPFPLNNGIERDNNGNWYITCYSAGRVYKYDSDFAEPPVLISTGHAGPTALGFNPVDEILAVPNFISSTVDFIYVGDTDGDGIIDILDNCPDDHNPEQCDYQPGEADGNHPRDILDIVHLIDYKFKECPPGAGYGTCPPPTPFAIYSGDTDCNCIVDILDIVQMIDWKFKECPPGAGQGTCPPPCSCEEWISVCQCPIR
jgi:hypothetical protein